MSISPKTKKILVIVLIIVIVVALCIGIYFLAFNDTDKSWRIRRIGNDGIVNHRDYNTSRLWVHANNTFEIEIIETIGDGTEIIFTGVGTYTKSGSTYTFTYKDSYTNTRIGPTLPNTVQQYQVKSGRIQFVSHWGISYHFGR